MGSDLASILNELTRITTNLRQAVSLVQVISYWPEENGPVTIDHWKFILHWTCENSFFEIILMIQLLRIDRGKLSSEAQLEIFNILKTKKSLLNHCFLYGLLSRDSDVREVTLQTFVTLHPDHRAYQITYRVLCCLGYYSKLPLSHQKECLLAVIQDRDRMCLLFVSMILSYRKFGSSVSVCKQWLEIPDGVIFGFKNWVQVERQILESAKQNWFAVIPKTLLEGDILASILSGPNDINKVFDIISLYLLAKEGKKALDDSLEAHYQLDPTSLTQFL